MGVVSLWLGYESPEAADPLHRGGKLDRARPSRRISRGEPSQHSKRATALDAMRLQSSTKEAMAVFLQVDLRLRDKANIESARRTR